MNDDPAGTRSPHLDLGDLIAGAAGQPAGGPAREHLAGCERCQREATRWNLVAGGVRGLAAVAPQAAAGPEVAQPARSRRTRRRAPSGPWRGAGLVVGSTAAALVLLVAIGSAAGVVHIHVSLPGHGAGAALTAVTGCSRLQQADGTLEHVNSRALVIRSASDHNVTVTTAASTFVSMSGPLLTDITDGALVMVRGHNSGGTLTAALVTVGEPFSAVNPSGFIPVRGTAADVNSAGFTLVTSGGERVPVTTSGSTLVVVPHASLGQLRAGSAVVAVGHARSDGTLSAQAVAAVSRLPSGARLSVSVKNCSAGSVTEALGAISATPLPRP